MKGVGRVRVARARIVGALGEEMRVFNHGGSYTTPLAGLALLVERKSILTALLHISSI